VTAPNHRGATDPVRCPLSPRRRRPLFDLTAGYSEVMALSDEKYIRVTTFKKDGTEVSTPTWVVALDDGKVGFYTSSTSGKAKRLKNNPKVVVQPSDGRGRARQGTSPLNGTAVVVTGPERDAIYDKVVAKYGFMTKVTRSLAKIGGFVKRKSQPYADRAVVVTLSE
jgi:PPOX class probable F420-dependent enzyme